MSWIAPALPEIDEPLIAPEQTMVSSWLAMQRSAFLSRCSGLAPEQLAQRTIPPSPLSLLGLIRHLTDMERIWFRVRLAGEDVAMRYPAKDVCFREATPATAEADYHALVDEWLAADQVLAGRALDETFVHPVYGSMSLRWLQHVLREYAGHIGHADLLREQIDGTTFS